MTRTINPEAVPEDPEAILQDEIANKEVEVKESLIMTFFWSAILGITTGFATDGKPNFASSEWPEYAYALAAALLLWIHLGVYDRSVRSLNGLRDFWKTQQKFQSETAERQALQGPREE